MPDQTPGARRRSPHGQLTTPPKPAADLAHDLPGRVLRTTAAVMRAPRCVSLNDARLAALAAEAAGAPRQGFEWDAEMHYTGDPVLTAQYVLVLDSLNFCFWPVEGLAYADLAVGLREAVRSDTGSLDADRLVNACASDVEAWFGRAMPDATERARLVRELGAFLVRDHGGRAIELIDAAGGSAITFAEALAAGCPGFQDHAVLDGRQVFFYKRAQIAAADIWGALGGHAPADFRDIDRLTTFADYRLPQLLRLRGALVLGRDLAERIDSGREVLPGSREEIEIRSATIQAVARLVADLAELGARRSAVEVDWWLWHTAEAEARSTAPAAPLHHRTRTVHY